METAIKQKLNTADLARIALFTAVMAVCSWISIPTAIPFTLQTFGVFLTVGVLGGKKGSLAVLVYLLLGAAGLPVFAGFSGGIGCIIGSTGGYMAGFLLAALLMWAAERLFGRSRTVLLLSMVLGLLVCYLFGTLWYVAVYTRTTGAIGFWTALTWCVIPYLLPDGVKLALAFLMRNKLAAACRLS